MNFFAKNLGILFAISSVGWIALPDRAVSQQLVADIDFEDVEIPEFESIVNVINDNTAFLPSTLSGANGANTSGNVTQVLYDTQDWFGGGTSNKIAFTKDGNGTAANGGTSATGGTPSMYTPAPITGGGGFQLSFDFFHPKPTWTDLSGAIPGGANGQRIALTTSTNNTDGTQQPVALRLSQVSDDPAFANVGRFYALREGGGLSGAAPAGFPAVNYNYDEKHHVVVVGNFSTEVDFDYIVGEQSFSVLPQHYHVWLDNVHLWGGAEFSAEIGGHGGNIPFRYDPTTEPARDFTSASRLLIAGSSNAAVSSAYFDNFQVWDFGGLLGDYNSDGVVDAADYVVWRDSMSDQPGKYDEWKANFGTGSEGSSAAAGQQVAVPEPSTLLLIASTLAAFAGFMHRQ